MKPDLARRTMSGLNGPHTQATGFNFSNSQLDSQPNYSFNDLTQDGNGYADFPEFTGLTQVGRQASRSALCPEALTFLARAAQTT